MRKAFYLSTMAALGLTLSLVGPEAQLNAQQPSAATVRLGASDLGGVVTSANGPEAGVWVIAETKDLPTKFVKIVVTDDQGRYVLPELPKANYDVWVRGYGLVDSPKVKAAPGKARRSQGGAGGQTRQRRRNIIRRNTGTRCSRFPTRACSPAPAGPGGNGMSDHVKNQGQWLVKLKTHACNSCHQLGNKPTRTICQGARRVQEFRTRPGRIASRSGPRREVMVRDLSEIDTQVALKNFADWTDRIAAGELPKSKPHRPQGVERNVVVTDVGLGRRQDLPA